jgi:hypothetical protein
VFRDLFAPLPFLLPVVDARALATLRCGAALAFALALVGCASMTTTAPSTAPGRPVDAEPPPPGVNLSGFPLPYRQGYADGCASAGGRETKDATRYGSDGNYRTGWIDGRSICAKK